MPVSLGILCTQQLYPLVLHCAALATPGLFMRSIRSCQTSSCQTNKSTYVLGDASIPGSTTLQHVAWPVHVLC